MTTFVATLNLCQNIKRHSHKVSYIFWCKAAAGENIVDQEARGGTVLNDPELNQ